MSGKYIEELLIGIGIDAKQAEAAAKRLGHDLDGLAKKAKKAGSGIDKTEANIRKFRKTAEGARKFAHGLAVGMTALATGVAAVGTKVIGTAANFEKLKVQLKTVTGSQGGANSAFEFIKNFAKETPFQVEEITNAFVKLKNIGLEPSREALTAYGDTASAMGKSLDQMIEAVADATTGEFERLKEFGIKARSEGDQVAFTFRGQTETVQKSGEAIERYLLNLGKNNFGGAMADQMGTLNGMISNLKDSLAEFFLTVAEMGPLEEFKGLISDIQKATGNKDGLAKTLARVLTGAIKKLRRIMKSDLIGTLEKVAKVIGFLVDNFDKLIFLFGAAKTLQAFNAAAAGLTQMGVAAASALGPIGAIMAAFLALLPVALEVGDALGNAITQGRQGTPSVEKRGEIKTLGDDFGDKAFAAGKIQKEINRETQLLLRLDGDNRGQSQSAKQARTRLRDAERRKGELKRGVDKRRAATALENSGLRNRQDAEANNSRDLQGQQKAFEIENNLSGGLENVSRSLGIKGEPSVEQKMKLDKARLALMGGKSLAEARYAAGLDRSRRGGGGGRKADKKVTSATTVSEFFAQAASGDLGPIASRTPSTKDIEPTVAVDITNNNYTFNIEQDIKGGDAMATGKASADAVRAEFDKRTARAAQNLQTNVLR